MEFAGDVRLVTLGGSTSERIRGREVIAESHVSLNLDTLEKKEVCLEKLEESDRRLASGPITTSPGYDWQFVFEESLSDGTYKVHFGVAWYDSDFFESKKTVFEDRRHQGIFSSFGVDAEDVSVSHWVKERN